MKHIFEYLFSKKEDLTKYSKRKTSKKVQVGDTIHIVKMSGESEYDGKEGKVKFIDSLGQLLGTWGSLAVIPGVDEFYIL